MNDNTISLLNLINEKKTAKEIANELKISQKQLYNHLTMLKNRGFNFDRKYYYDGSIVYEPIKELKQVSNEYNLITTPDDKKFVALVISDLHIGSVKQRLDLLYRMYDYCAMEGINIILVVGDLINGTIGSNNVHDNVYDQIDYFLKKYPFDENIINFGVLGNHDITPLTDYGQDLAVIINNYRHDIIPVGYGVGDVNIKNDKITLSHPIKINENVIYDSSLVLRGHAHNMKISMMGNSNKYIINIPSLSDIYLSDNEILPAVVKLTLNFNHGIFSLLNLQHILLGDKNYVINEIKLPINFKESILFKDIRLEEKPRVRKLTNIEDVPDTYMANQIKKYLEE